MNLKNLTISAAKKMLLNKEISAVELTTEYLNRIKESKLNAFITICEDSSIASAKISDENIAKNQAKKLEGIPLGIKDLFCTTGVKTTSASKMLEKFVPQYNADVVERLVDENFVMLGKLNMDEFAMGSTTTNSYFGDTINPLKSKLNPDANLTPGGSSGGSAAAVAGDLCIAAIGSDTGGSVRQPAAFCGLVGAKSSYGVCSRYGMISYASSFDQAGFLAKNVEDTAYLMEIIAGHSARDSMMYKNLSYDFTKNIKNGVSGMKIAIPKEFASDNVPSYVLTSIEKCKQGLEKQGAKVDYIDIKHIEKSINVYYIITPAEMCSNLAKFDGIRYGLDIDLGDIKNMDEYYSKIRSEGFGEEVKRRIMVGNYILSSEHYQDYYVKAQKIRQVISNEFSKVFESYDAVICPTALNAAFDVKTANLDPVKTYLNDICSVPANLAGLPAISVPFGVNNEGLPIGVQVMTDRLEDAKMYQVAHSIEELAKLI